MSKIKQPLPKLEIYHKLVKSVHEKMHQWEINSHEKLTESLHKIADKAQSLSNVTRKEIDQMTGYLKRDLQDITHFIAEATDPKTEWRQWLKFDLEQIEQQTLEKLFEIADTSQLEFQKELESRLEFHTGEIKSVGSLECTACGQTIHFKAPGHIPPCPSCHHTVFRRLKGKRVT